MQSHGETSLENLKHVEQSGGLIFSKGEATSQSSLIGRNQCICQAWRYNIMFACKA